MNSVWIGVDLDGTLAEYHGWDNGKIGRPIPKMINRVKTWLSAGKNVKIMTARVNPGGKVEDVQYHIKLIEDWCLEHIGHILPVTCTKDYQMYELWDDRAVQVVPNMGITLEDIIKEKDVVID